MEIAKVQTIYFLGIGGIGMSALARYFNSSGVKVSGYDLVETPLTQALSREGMDIHYKEDIKKIPAKVDLIVWTPAIPATHKELVWVKKQGLPLLKRAEVLGLLSKSYETIAVAGTHGKTTTSSILTHLLKESGQSITAFLGGILAEVNSNFISGDSDVMIVEADEYDRSFLHLYPKMLIILSMDHDHIDIYKDEAALYEAYGQLMDQVTDAGLIVLGPDVIRNVHVERLEKLARRNVKVVRIFNDFEFNSITINEGQYEFDFQYGKKIKRFTSNLPGNHNLINTTLAIVICKELGLKDAEISKALKSFRGIRRRFQLVHSGDRVLYDDYAHLPEEVGYAVRTIKELYPTGKVLGIFQPHLYSRTLEFYQGFAKELSGLDGVILLPVYPAREEPMEGVESELVYNLITMDDKELVEAKNLLKTLKDKKDYQVIMTIGAADLDKHHKDIIELIK